MLIFILKVKRQCFPPKIKNKTVKSAFIIPIKHYAKGLASGINQGKEIKEIQI